MELRLNSGCLQAQVSHLETNCLEHLPPLYQLESSYTITIIDSSEIEGLPYETEVIDDYLFILGLGKKEQPPYYYLFVHCNTFNKIRLKNGLSKKNFYILLDTEKQSSVEFLPQVSDIIWKNEQLDLSQVYRLQDITLLKYIERVYQYLDPKIKILELKKNKCLPQHIDYLIENNIYLGYIFKFEMSQDIEDLIKAVHMYSSLVHQKYDPRSSGTHNMIKVLNGHLMAQYTQKQQHLYLLDSQSYQIIRHPMPSNLSWLIPNKIGGISRLLSEQDLLVLEHLGIRKIYYFLEKKYFQGFKNDNLQIEYIHCLNKKAPLFDDLLRLFETETFENPVLFGCLGGFGRTGTALACYLCYHGLNQQKMSSEQAIQYLREKRPKSIETDEQINFIRQFWINIQKSPAPKSKLKTPIKFIMLVGLPGSGKTTFCDLFLSSGLNVKIVTQDTMGRNMCQQSLLKFIKDSDIVILDRTNYLIKDRHDWLTLTDLEPKQCLCIYLSTPKFICLQRVSKRTHHPSIKTGGGHRIILDIDSQLEIPTKEEGFSQVIYLEDQEDVREYLKTWKCTQISLEDSSETHIHKFPRTPHLFNIGGATVDDRYVREDQYEYFLKNEVQVTEKVDGAQMGFSINEDFQIMVQNRSHYVTSQSAAQFKLLDKWVHQHRDDLYSILDKDHILFGEWMYAKHSIEYNNLPDYFMAFDLYNKRERVFYNRRILEQKLEGTQIQIVRIMYQGLINKKQLLELIEQPSEYTNSRVEGVYLKVFEGKFVKYRSKLVRNDFLAGNQHWSKREVQPNQLSHENY